MERANIAPRLRRFGASFCTAAAVIALIGLAIPAHALAASASDHLWGVSCPSAWDCVAVGGTGRYTSEGSPLARAWNGRRWVAEPAGRHGLLLAVSCRYRRACTAVGVTNSGYVLALRWNGKKWSAQHTPGTGGGRDTYGYMRSVACPSATACMAVGTVNGGNLAERWNGKRWSIVPVPVPAGTIPEGVDTVSCRSASNCMAFAEYDTAGDFHELLAEHWNGTAWTFQPTPAVPETSDLTSASCPSATACLAVGLAPQGEGPPLPLAMAWNGTNWRILPTAPHPDAYAQFSGVSCASARSCIAVGLACTSLDTCTVQGSRGIRALAERWNGASWTILRTPEPADAELDSVSCTSVRACTAVGHGKSGLLAERWDGKKWKRQGIPG
jgi:hypothetical protein